MPTLPQIFIALISALFPIVGISLIIESYQSFHLNMHSKKWSKASAKFTHYEVHRYTTGGRTSKTEYDYVSICAYEVEERFYVNRDSRHRGFKTWEEAENAASASCPIGQSLDLFYNPKDPARSTLSPGLNWDSIWGILFAVVWTALSAIPLLSMILGHSFRQAAQ
jgi:Protein of unknown function (DUF3592)